MCSVFQMDHRVMYCVSDGPQSDAYCVSDGSQSDVHGVSAGPQSDVHYFGWTTE